MWILVSYLIGSIPIAKFVAKRELNFYSTSEVIRELGWRKGIYVGIVDISKGILAVSLATYFGLPAWATLLSGLSAVAGQIFPAFNSFRGGGGLLTSYGALLVINSTLASVAFVIVVPFIVIRKPWVGIILAWVLLHTWAIMIGEYKFVNFGTGHVIMVAVAYLTRTYESRR